MADRHIPLGPGDNARYLRNRLILSTPPTVNQLLQFNGEAWDSVSIGTAPGLVELLNGLIPDPDADTYTIQLYAYYAAIINELKVILAAGTCTVAIKINDVAVTGISAVAASSVIATGTASGSNSVSIGDKISIVISAVVGATDLAFTLKNTRA